MTRRKKLIQLMTTHDLEAKDVAKLIDREPSTVWHWTSNSDTNIPAPLLELLEMKIQKQEAAEGLVDGVEKAKDAI